MGAATCSEIPFDGISASPIPVATESSMSHAKSRLANKFDWNRSLIRRIPDGIPDGIPDDEIPDWKSWVKRA